ncbi:fatty acid synthase Fas [Mycobacteroides abscessus subsp. abscessus]|nr:fatty acid synthase Fas [Mycobacteroides abscessus subsp. abscessus]
MSAFAVVSGDHNPIHTDKSAALLAGLGSPIVHGMWLSAAAQHVVTSADASSTPPRTLIGWTSRFLGMVQPGDEVDIRVDRVGTASRYCTWSKTTRPASSPVACTISTPRACCT